MKQGMNVFNIYGVQRGRYNGKFAVRMCMRKSNYALYQIRCHVKKPTNKIDWSVVSWTSNLTKSQVLRDRLQKERVARFDFTGTGNHFKQRKNNKLLKDYFEWKRNGVGIFRRRDSLWPRSTAVVHIKQPNTAVCYQLKMGLILALYVTSPSPTCKHKQTNVHN